MDDFDKAQFRFVFHVAVVGKETVCKLLLKCSD